ncbi:MAG: tRNA-dihydrouridine synthase family protein [Deltaproteobacteria bacterium]|nr:tRNA-dihydrouridine synthase family protein [Deltaproteobacteria bacterium]
MKSYNIRNLVISPGLVLSPMSGVTTSAFRRLIKELNPGTVGLVISEFISAEAMTRNVKRSLDMMRFHESERPYGIQIFGFDIARMSDAARMVQDAGVDLVDINCGCPAPKVVRKGGGCELMRQPDHLAKLIASVRAAVTIPLTIKIRSGWDSSSVNAIDIARIAQQEGAEAIAIHGRTRAQMYRGDADWELVEKVASEASIPVLGSGDIIDYQSAGQRLSGAVAGLFIGRASMSNPFVFGDIVNRRQAAVRSRPQLVFAALERYVELLSEEFPASGCAGKFKQLVSQMARGFSWRKDILTAVTFEQQIELLRRAKENDCCRDVQWQPSGLLPARAGA